MSRSKTISVRSTDTTHVQPNRSGNLITRNSRVVGALGCLAALGTVVYGAVNLFSHDKPPTISVLTTLKECGNDHRDAPLQPAEYYTGQEFTFGLGTNALSHTVRLKMLEGGKLEQEEVDKGVKVLTEILPAEPNQKPTGLKLTYELVPGVQVTVTSHPGQGTSPTLTPVEFGQLC